MLKILLLLVMVSITFTAVTPFDKSIVDRVFKENQFALFLLTTTNSTSDQAKQVFYQVAQENDNLLFSHSDAADQNNFYRKLAQYIGVDYENPPHILYYGEDKKKYLFQGQYTKQNLLSFLKSAEEGSLKIHVKSTPVSQPNEGPVMDLIGNNFKQLVLDSEKEFFVKLYAPWCPHSREIVEEFEEVAKRLGKNQNIMIAQMDYTQNQIYGIEIPGYPTLKFWKKDKTLEPLTYEGKRKADEMMLWLEENTEYPWVAPLEKVQKKQEVVIEKVEEPVEPATTPDEL